MTNYTERSKILQDALWNDPANPPPGSSTGEVNAARLFLSRLKAGMCDVAKDLMPDVVPSSGPELNAIALARRWLDQTDYYAPTVMKALFAVYDDLTPAQFAAMDDSDIKAGILVLVPSFSAGLSVKG